MEEVQPGVHSGQSKSISARLRNLLYYPWSPRPFAFQSEIGYTLTAATPSPPSPSPQHTLTHSALLRQPCCSHHKTRHPEKLIWTHQRQDYVCSLKWRYGQLKVPHKSGCLYAQQDGEGAWWRTAERRYYHYNLIKTAAAAINTPPNAQGSKRPNAEKQPYLHNILQVWLTRTKGK